MNSQKLEDEIIKAFNITGIIKLDNLCQNMNTNYRSELGLLQFANMLKLLRISKEVFFSSIFSFLMHHRLKRSDKTTKFQNQNLSK